MECHEARELFEEYRRHELPPDRAQAVERHLEGCPACRAFWAREEAVAAVVRALPRQVAPPTLARQVRSLGAHRRGLATWIGRPWVAVAVAALVVAAVLAPWLRRPTERPGDIVDTLIQSGVAEHRRILLGLEAAPQPIGDPETLLQRIGSVTAVEVPKVLAGTDELHLVAIRPTLLASRKTVAVTLRYETSPDTTYFILRGADLPMPNEGRVQIEQYRPHMRQVNGFNVVYWKQNVGRPNDTAYLMVSGLDREGCQKLYLKVRRAM
jgi:Putative zinc-finger